MDVDEKLTELKRAYADMILNTAKEAAGRIMMSERKAHRLEFEVKESKENALHMLTRLKQMMDSKVVEAEMVSRIQQKKLEELEAQLQEAEDIVKDLREELSSMQAELERTKPKPNNSVNPDSIPTSDFRNSDKDQSNKGQILYNSLFPFCQSYVNDQNLPAIILRSKGRKLYRSGCTHRIHACEGDPCEQTNVIKPDLITETDEESEKLHKDPSLTLGDERKRASPNGKKRSQPLDQVEEIGDVADSSYSSIAKSAKYLREDSDESINTVLDVSDAHSRLREEVLPIECEKTELPLTSEAPVDAPELKAVETGGVGVPIHTTSGRVIKYTFQRKRKRGALSTNGSDLGDKMKKKEEDGNALLETEKVIATEKSTQEETEKVKSMEESTQGENGKVVSIEESTLEETHQEKVAKQLIALSTKNGDNEA